VIDWPATKARRVLAALIRQGWRVLRQTGSHRVLARPGWPNVIFAFHDDAGLGPRMLAQLAGQHAGYAVPRIRSLAHSTTAAASATARACSASVTGSLPPG